MKYLFVALALVSIASCGRTNVEVARFTGHSEQCIRGVMYYQFPTGATVAVDRTGTPIRC